MGMTIQQIERALKRAEAQGKGVKTFGKVLKQARRKAGPGKAGARPRTPKGAGKLIKTYKEWEREASERLLRAYEEQRVYGDDRAWDEVRAAEYNLDNVKRSLAEARKLPRGAGKAGARGQSPRHRVVGLGPNASTFYEGTAATKAAALKLVAAAKGVPGVIHIELQSEDAFGVHEIYYDKNRRGVWQRPVDM